MYKWYQKAEICYVYLADFSLSQQVLALNQQERITKFAKSRWFTRGWTLQELLAPQYVVFYDRDWIELGSRSFLEHEISQATRISPKHMKQPKDASVATKMSWASIRNTSREEDIAYSLLGLFDIHMPLIYGEGQNAFFRLQSEIIRTSSDESIYAWIDSSLSSSGLLARTPRAFYHSSDIVPIEGLSSLRRSPPYMTNRGLAIEIKGSQKSQEYGEEHLLLNCARLAKPEYLFKLKLRSQGQLASRIDVPNFAFYKARVAEPLNVKMKTIYVENGVKPVTQVPRPSLYVQECLPLDIKLGPAAQDTLLFLRYLEPFEYVLFFI